MEKRGGDPERVGRIMPDGVQGFIESLKKRSEAFGAQYFQRMEACSPGAEACVNLSGRILMSNGHQQPCERVEKEPLGCVVGRNRYIAGCETFLNSIGLRGTQAKACFLSETFVRDELSNIAYDYAFNGGFDKEVDLFLAGTMGPGKTYSCHAILAHLHVTRGVSGLKFNAHRLLSSGRWNEDLDAAVKTKLLLLDDLGLEPKTEGVQANLVSLIDERFESGYRTLITSNIKSFEQLSERYDDRFLDRLARYKILFTKLESKR